MEHRIEYEKWTFTAGKIRSGNVYLASSLLSSSLEVNSFTAAVECDDPSILDFERNAPLRYYVRQNQPMIFRVQNITRTGPALYNISATSTLGLLVEGKHYGGIYSGQTAKAVISSICGNVPFIVKSSLEDIKLYGWLPIASPRDNLSQVLFAIGATLRTDLDGILRIQELWNGISGSAPKSRIYVGATVDYDSKVTEVVVTEHQYVPWTEEKQLFDGSTQAGDIITFSEPMHGLSATGFTILDSGANWAKVSAGTGILTGKTYIHNTRQVRRDVLEAASPNVKTVSDATLVSIANSYAVSQRLANYYRCRETVDADVLYGGEIPGDLLSAYHPFDKTDVSGCLESADISLSNVLKARANLLVGYVPPWPGELDYIDNTLEITESCTVQLPEGVTEVTAVLIGGGDGGQRGGNGASGGDGTRAYTSGNLSKPSSLTQGTPGKGGAGGAAGAGGTGGKILVVDIDINGTESLIIHVGAKGAANSGTGGASTITVGNQIFSSNSGSSSGSGYTDIISGKVYAKPGLSGEYSGGKGGDGVSGTTGSGGNGESVAGYSGGAGNNYAANIGAPRYTLPAGGGGAAYGGSGGNATSGCRGGTGGNASQNRQAPSIPGCGGHGGNGGGGAGGGGAGYIDGGLPETQMQASGNYGGSGGSGSNGTAGAPGIVLLFYRSQKRISSGWLIDKNGKRFLDNLVRRFVT